MAANLLTTSMNDNPLVSDDPAQQDGQIPQQMPQTELERIINQRFRESMLAQGIPLHMLSQQYQPQPTSPGGGWQEVYRSSDPDAQRRVFDQQMIVKSRVVGSYRTQPHNSRDNRFHNRFQRVNRMFRILILSHAQAQDKAMQHLRNKELA